MAKGKLWEYAILYHPKPKRSATGEDISEQTIILKEPTILLATSEKEAGILAARELPQEYVSKIEDVDIAIRPF